MSVVDDERRHCDSCARTLTDFTKMSDDELVLFFKYNRKKVCGRFSIEQLNRQLQLIPESRNRSVSGRAIWLLPLTLLARWGFAQQADSIPPVDTVSVTVDDSVTIERDSSLTQAEDTSVSVAVGDTVIIPETTPPKETKTIISLDPKDCRMGVVYNPPPVIVGNVGYKRYTHFTPTLYDPNGLAVLFAPDPETPDTILDTNPDHLVSNVPEKNREEPAPATPSPWYEAILPSSLRIRRKT